MPRAFYEAAGAEVRDRMHWNNGERADVFLGPVMITLFTHAIYEGVRSSCPPEGFPSAFFTDDLDVGARGPHGGVGSEVVEGGRFRNCRIAFVDAPGGIRLEFMEQLDRDPHTGKDAVALGLRDQPRGEQPRRRVAEVHAVGPQHGAVEV